MRMSVPTSVASPACWAAALTLRKRYKSMACLVVAAFMLAGCQSFGQNNDITGSIPGVEASAPTDQAALFHYSEELGQRYESNPNDKRLALTYAHTLRQLSRYAQAVAVLQRLAATYPKDMVVLGDYGKALVDAGRLQEASNVLPQAHTPENPNWTILSAQGSVADQLGDHVKAQEYYAAALKIMPNQPDVLSNLGLSYALSKQLPMAETMLRLAAAQPGAGARVRQNLALVLALEGKFAAAQDIAQRDMPPLQAAENVAAVRQMIAQANPWKQIRALDAKKARRVAFRRGVTRKRAFTEHEGKPLTASNQKTPWVDAARPTTTASE